MTHKNSQSGLHSMPDHVVILFMFAVLASFGFIADTLYTGENKEQVQSFLIVLGVVPLAIEFHIIIH